MKKENSYDKDGYILASYTRWEDARALFAVGKYEGACYMAGYAVEMVLKYIVMDKRGCNTMESYKELSPVEINNLINNRRINYRGNDYTHDNLATLFKKFADDLRDNIYIHDLYRLIKLLDEVFIADIGYSTFRSNYDKLGLWWEQWRYQIERGDSAHVAIDENFAKQFFLQVDSFFDELEKLSLIQSAIRSRFPKMIIEEGK